METRKSLSFSLLAVDYVLVSKAFPPHHASVSERRTNFNTDTKVFVKVDKQANQGTGILFSFSEIK